MLLLPAVLFLVLAFVLPVVGMLGLSVTSPAGGVTFAQFARVIDSDFHVSAASRALRLSLVQTVITVILATPLAYVMARVGSFLRATLLVIVILPLMTSVVVRSFGWVVLMGPSGLLPQLPPFSFLADRQGLLGTEPGIVIAMVQVLLPFATLTILGVTSAVKPQLEEAARTLGASFWNTMRLVVIPLITPGMVAGAVLVFALSVSSFITPRMIGGYQLPVLAGTIYTDATTNLDWPFAAAQAVLLFVGVLLVISASLRIGRVKF